MVFENSTAPKVADILRDLKPSKPGVSFEITPPKRGISRESVDNAVRSLMKYNPRFIDVTSHPQEYQPVEIQGREKEYTFVARRKSVGTGGICSRIQSHFNVPAVPHLLCLGFTREETEDFVVDMYFAGINTFLAIQGDDKGYRKPARTDRTTNTYASDLVAQLKGLARGEYVERTLEKGDPLDLCIGIAGYPERQKSSPNIETDLHYLKMKVETAGDGRVYIVPQMCFDNEKFFEWLELCRKSGINVPIVYSTKVLSTRLQVLGGMKVIDGVEKRIESVPESFNVTIPYETTERVRTAKTPDEVREIMLQHTERQIREALATGLVTDFHFYTMLNTRPVTTLLDRLGIFS